MTRVLVVGGGITGLTAAHALAALRPGAVDRAARGDDRLGGKIRTSPFAGLPAVDEGADAFLARVPQATALARDVGLGDGARRRRRTPPPRSGTTAAPDPGGPAARRAGRHRQLARSDLLTWRGKARAALEPLLPRTDAGDSIGTLVRGRFGDEVHERLVDALVGSIYAADTDRFSLAMVPQLAGLAGRGRSLLLAARAHAAAPAAAGPLFYAPARAASGASSTPSPPTPSPVGVTLTLGAPVGPLAADGTRWRVDEERYDAVVLATPAAPSAPLLAAVAPESSRLLATMDHADVVLVTLAVAGWPERLRGPQRVPRAETGAGAGDRGVVRIAEVGALAGRGR